MYPLKNKIITGLLVFEAHDSRFSQWVVICTDHLPHVDFSSFFSDQHLTLVNLFELVPLAAANYQNVKR